MSKRLPIRNSAASVLSTARVIVGVVLLALSFEVLGAPVARAAEDDGRLWASVAAQTSPIDRFTAALQLQGRFFDDIGDYERLLIRPSIGFAATPRTSLTLGYDAHLIDGPSEKTEHRVWQQISYAAPLGAAKLFGWLRLEERLLEGVSGTAVRLRILGRLDNPIGRSPFAMILWNEAFFDLNDRSRGGIEAGFGEDRFFAGLGRSFDAGAKGTTRIGAEVGYMIQYVDRAGADLAAHTLFLALSLKH